MKHSTSRTKFLLATKTLLATLAQTAPETALLQTSIEALMELTQVKYGAIGLLDEQGNLVQFVHAGMSEEEIASIGTHPPKGSGLLGVVIQENVCLRLDNMADDPRSKGFPGNHPKMNSLLAVPISNDERVYGRIYLCDKFDKSPFSEEDEELALSYANALSLILNNARKMHQLEQEQSVLEHTAFHDPLTKLPNRTLLCDRIGQALNHAKRSRTQFAILFCDLDGFKAINDTLGHQAGDHVLKTMGERFVDCVRGNDTVARIGGDEFIFVLSEIESVENTETVANKILEVISQSVSFEDHEIMLSASIGIAVYPLDGEATECLVNNADVAMYQAKKKGKNQYRFFVEGLLADSLTKLEKSPAPLWHEKSKFAQ